MPIISLEESGVFIFWDICLFEIAKKKRKLLLKWSVVVAQNMKGVADEWRCELTGLAAHGDAQLHARQRRTFIRGQS